MLQEMFAIVLLRKVSLTTVIRTVTIDSMLGTEYQGTKVELSNLVALWNDRYKPETYLGKLTSKLGGYETVTNAREALVCELLTKES